MKTTLCNLDELNQKPPVGELGFGKHFTDHMLQIRWTEEHGWEDPEIGPLRPFQMHPAAKVNWSRKYYLDSYVPIYRTNLFNL